MKLLHLLYSPSASDRHEDWRLACKKCSQTVVLLANLFLDLSAIPHWPTVVLIDDWSEKLAKRSRAFDANQPTSKCRLQMSLSLTLSSASLMSAFPSDNWCNWLQQNGDREGEFRTPCPLKFMLAADPSLTLSALVPDIVKSGRGER